MILSFSDWSLLHNSSFALQCFIWNQCQSYCCSHQYSKFLFKRLAKAAGIIFLKDEFDFLQKNNFLTKEFEENARIWEIKITEDVVLEFVTTICRDGGKCSIDLFHNLILAHDVY